MPMQISVQCNIIGTSISSHLSAIRLGIYVALIVSLTEEEQTLIDSIAERVVNGSPNEEKIIRAKSLANEELRYVLSFFSDGMYSVF